MHRPNITPLPTKKRSISDLKLDRTIKNQSLFRTRILPRTEQNIPRVNSKSLNCKLLKLYPEIK